MALACMSLRWLSIFAYGFTIMGNEQREKRAIDRGPVSRRVAENVRKLREKRRLTRQQVSDHLAALGRHILPSGVAKLEEEKDKGARRVDVDDLVALALVLDVSPLRLLLPETAEEDEYDQLTDVVSVSRRSAWKWARGEESLFAGTAYTIEPEGRGLEHGAEVYRRRSQFPRENRPDLEVPPMERVGPHWGALQQLWLDARAVADEIGCSVESVLGLVPSAEVIEVARRTHKEGTTDGER